MDAISFQLCLVVVVMAFMLDQCFGLDSIYTFELDVSS